MPEEWMSHYAVKVINMPPTSITCKCGQVFTGDNPIAEIKTHMEEENDDATHAG